MLTKSKYVGINMGELLTVYKLFIRCIPEYCSVVFNKSLTIEQSNKIENIQKTCLKIILGESYLSYESALQTCSLEKLSDRRDKRMLKFALKCTKDPRNSELFPKNDVPHKKEVYKVNFARTEAYLQSAIPQCQRLLNIHSKVKDKS